MVVHITTEVASPNPAHDEVYSIQHYVIKFVGASTVGRGLFPSNPMFSINKTDHHDIA